MCNFYIYFFLVLYLSVINQLIFFVLFSQILVIIYYALSHLVIYINCVLQDVYLICIIIIFVLYSLQTSHYFSIECCYFVIITC